MSKYKIIFFTTVLFSSLHAEFYNSTSFQGYTGLLNIPNAEVLEEGKFEFAFSNQVDITTIKREDYKAENYFVNFGLLPNFEIGGRLAQITPNNMGFRYFNGVKIKDFYMRDVSANIKFQIPLYYKYLPKVAIGIQDIGGAASHYDSKYVVMSKEFSYLRATLGYGYASNRLNGYFGGLEIKAHDLVYLMGEYDTKEKHIGIRLNTPKSFFKFGDVSLFAKKNLDYEKEDYVYGVNFKFNLGRDYSTKKIEQKIKNDISIDKRINQVKTEEKVEVKSLSTKKTINNLRELKYKLIEIGFENIDIGERYDEIYIAYENHIFDRNELDAIGVILGHLKELEKYKYFTIVIKKSNLKVKKLSGNLGLYRSFIEKETVDSINNFKNSLSLLAATDNIDNYNMLVENENSSYFKTRIDLSPALVAFAGTEFGLYDYLLLLQTHIHWTLYKGLDLSMVVNTPLKNSPNLDKETGVLRGYSNSVNEHRIDNIMLHKSNIFGNFLNTLSVGQYTKDYMGIMNNSLYTYGNHQLQLRLGYFSNDNIDDSSKVSVATYKYYYDEIDTQFIIATGKYFAKDSGYELALKRFFSDSALKLYYQNTNKSRYAGMAIEIPLTLRKYNSSKYVQLKGNNRFIYGMRTTINRADGSNEIITDGAITPITQFEIKNHLLNKNRLNESYIKRNILRLKDAYKTYVLNIDE